MGGASDRQQQITESGWRAYPRRTVPSATTSPDLAQPLLIQFNSLIVSAPTAERAGDEGQEGSSESARQFEQPVSDHVVTIAELLGALHVPDCDNRDIGGSHAVGEGVFQIDNRVHFHLHRLNCLAHNIGVDKIERHKKISGVTYFSTCNPLSCVLGYGHRNNGAAKCTT